MKADVLYAARDVGLIGPAYEVRSVMDDNCRLHADEVLGAMFLNVRVLCEEYVFHGCS